MRSQNQSAEMSDVFPESRFPLLRRITVISLAAMVVTAILLIFAYRQDQLSEHSEIAARGNEITLIRLMSALDSRLNAYTTSGDVFFNEVNRMSQALDPLIASVLHEINEDNVLKVKIYHLSGTAIYSSVASEIGKPGQRPDFVARALRGETVHSLEHRDTYTGMAGQMNDVDIASTYMPLNHAGKRIGAIEIANNANGIFEHIREGIVQIATIVFSVFAGLYALLFFFVLKTDRAVLKWQKRITESEESLRESQTIAGLGSYVLDVRTGLWKSSEVLDRLFGITDGSDHALEEWNSLIHPEDRKMMADYLKNDVIGQGKAFDKQFRIVCHNGHAERWVHGLGKLEYDARGRPIKLRGTLQDITDSKLVERELRVAAVSFESQESLLITDAEGVILRVNQAFTDITGYTAEEAVGKTPRLLKSGRHNDDFYRAMWEAIKTTGTWQGEVWDRRKNGDVYPTWLTISAVKGSDGTITNYIGAHIDITRRKEAEEEINLLAFYDPLTRLPNRRLLFDRLRLALVSTTRSSMKGALLFIDLDNFKILNDTLGHNFGDLLLQEVAKRLESCVREGDTVARLGGDEFVVILEDLSKQPVEAASQAESIAEKIIATLDQPYLLGKNEYRSTPSIGATLFNDHDLGVDELFKQADIAMYQAKKAGRNTLRFFDPKMQDAINARATLEKELYIALEKQQFRLYYQVQMNNLRSPLGAEALIRWEHPVSGLLFPEQFIPLAEETGLILPIGKWVLDTACAQIKTWQQSALTRDLVLAVNVSARQFRQVDFAAQVKAATQRHAINPKLLKLELTESMLLDHIDDIIVTMNALNETGVQFSLDDFGTGYSSLHYLKQLPLDQIKIDQSFVRDLTADSSDNAVVRAIIAMAQSLSFDVIAEGVEMREQRQLLLEEGCTNYQGYLFGKPLPVEQFESLLKQG